MPTYPARPGLPIAALAAFLGLGGPAEAATYRCTDGKGRVTFQDSPCEGAQSATTTAGPNSGMSASPTVPSAAPTASSGASGYSSFRGAWRGPAQMHFTSQGVRDLTAHRVTPIVIEVQPDGKVRGVISEAGCKFSGLGGQFVQPQIASIDVTVTGCTDRRFDGRYSGTLAAYAGLKEARLNLMSNRIPTPMRKGELATIEAVLRR